MPGDAPNNPDQGYTTIRFSDESLDDKGMLDKYCALARAFYFLAVAILYDYSGPLCLPISQ